ncbi:MAG TPA: IS66 family transposase [Chitinophagaceae bacterium]|nr:IS66 family transposase [Chitinophagaceae bacterium]
MTTTPADIDYKHLYESTRRDNEQLSFKITQLQHELAQLKKLIFGSRQERFIPTAGSNQLALAITAEQVQATQVMSAQKVEYVRTKSQPGPGLHPGRHKLPAHLRREEFVLEPEAIPAGSKKIGEEITEQLECIPAELYVKKYIRPKYLAPAKKGNTESTIIIASLPAQPIDKCIAGPGLLAQLVIDKYQDHLPLHRQMQRFERAGVKLPYSTLTEWISATGKLITPLYECLKTEALKSNYLHVDETPIPVLDKNKKGKTHQGYFWVYHSSIQKLVLFDYREGRNKEGPSDILSSFKGYIQTDGYEVYEHIGKQEGITLLHCLAHSRRYFTEALQNDRQRAEYVLGKMQQLYAIERECQQKALSFDERKAVRCECALPILDALGEWMRSQYLRVLPKSPIGKALAYSIERWERLCRYTQDGRLCIDNNPVENSIRPVAVGRKNYLFCGSHLAAQRSAMLYSLLGTCKLHGLNPYTWLRDVLTQLPIHPINKIKELLPHNWAISQK